MLNLAPWYYRDFLLENNKSIFEKIAICPVKLINGEDRWEAVTKLKNQYLPSWVVQSSLYSSNEGSGTSSFRNLAIHKAISEGLERWAFYASIDESPERFSFDINPSTTGMAAFPERITKNARKKAIFEATERWSLHEFWRSHLPVREHATVIPNLRHFEIVTGKQDINVSLLHLRINDLNIFGFACDKDLNLSFSHALIELSRNVRVLTTMSKSIKLNLLSEIYDRRLYFFSTNDGLKLFNEKLISAPQKILSNPRLICDKEILGPWTNYAKVWRYLYDDTTSPDEDHTFFMF